MGKLKNYEIDAIAAKVRESLQYLKEQEYEQRYRDSKDELDQELESLLEHEVKLVEALRNYEDNCKGIKEIIKKRGLNISLNTRVPYRLTVDNIEESPAYLSFDTVKLPYELSDDIKQVVILENIEGKNLSSLIERLVEQFREKLDKKN